jgi:hypothetical protein
VTRFYAIQWIIKGNIATAFFQQWSMLPCVAFVVVVVLVSTLIVGVSNVIESRKARGKFVCIAKI